MNRLTERNMGNYGYYPTCIEKCHGEGASEKCDECEFSVKICERLAEYEDTGLTPDQIIEMDKLYSEMAKELGKYKKMAGDDLK